MLCKHSLFLVAVQPRREWMRCGKSETYVRIATALGSIPRRVIQFFNPISICCAEWFLARETTTCKVDLIDGFGWMLLKMQRVRCGNPELQIHVYKIETQCGRPEILSRMSSGVLAAQGFLIPLDLVQTQAGQPTDLLLLNIIGSILDSDSRRIGPNPVGAEFQQGIRGTSAVRNPSKVE